MMTRRTLLENTGLLALAASLPGAAAAQQQTQTPASRNRQVIQRDLPKLALDGWIVTAIEVAYAPGQSSPPHRHPGLTFAYVLEGAIRSKVGDGPERTYAAGEMFIEMPQELHAVSANASTDKPAKLLAILLTEKGVPLTAPAKE
jgi:quercetin dioxygenase-like cupin family protein